MDGKKRAGLDVAADLLSDLDKDHRERVLAGIAALDPAMARKLREAMCVFEDLIHVDPREIQVLVRELPPGLLAMAMRKVSAALKAHIFSGLSERAAEILREDIDALGPQRVSDVQAAQVQVMELAQKLESQGKILIKPQSKS